MGKKSSKDGVSNQVISSIVSDVFAKHGINPSDANISDAKKKEIKSMVSNLNKQVKDFVGKEAKKTKKKK